MDGSGQVSHRTGCSDPKLCTHASLVEPGPIGKRDNSLCSSCCLGDRCNNRTCLLSGIPQCTEWGTWAACDVTCGGGKQTRSRKCSKDFQQTTELDSRYCNSPTCPAHTVCNDVLDDCSSPDIKPAMCATASLALQYCKNTCGLCPVDGHWSEWSEWSACSASCGNDAHRIRLRLCNSPAPKNNGSHCQGNDRERLDCHTPCPVDGHWSDWSAWGACSKTCGGGQTLRIRNCNNPVPQNGGKPCENPAHFQEANSCGNIDCPVDGHWSDWSTWGACSKTCGGGQTFRIRNCNNPVPQNGGKPCENPANFQEAKSCGNINCPVDGHWSDWSTWGACTKTCGGGQTFRIRNCNNPVPQNGGKPCENAALFKETKSCGNIDCPVDGQWSDWSPWRPCTKTCGGGMTFRIRNCNNPVPQNGEKPCENPAQFKEEKSCGNSDCPVDGNWSEWSPWHPCSVTCGGGNTFRSRTCSNPVPQHGGKSCENPGSFVEKLPCGLMSCTGSGFASATTSLVSITSSVVTSVPSLVPSVGCNDQAFCTDSHILPLVCQDVYVATTYCPKLCGICGATSSPTPCIDSVGGSCNDPLYIQFACADNELAALCAKTCGVCH